MTGRGFYVGHFFDIDLLKERRVGVVTLIVDVHDVAPLLQQLRPPPTQAAYWADHTAAAAVAILPCRHPRHPEREQDVAAEAAVTFLENYLVRDGDGGSPELLGRLLRVAHAAPQLMEAAARREGAQLAETVS